MRVEGMAHDRRLMGAVLLVLGLLVASSCGKTGGGLIVTQEEDADQLPTTIGVYPLISQPVPPRVIFGREPVTLKVEGDQIYVAPPTEMKLAVTAQSQMLTSLITTELAGYGFDLRELPVEVPANSQGEAAVFVISLALLDELREEYGLGALLIGNAFFVRSAGAPPQTRVTFAHLKLVDTATLEVLCQLTLPLDDYGQPMDRLAGAMATELAILAGLVQ